MVRRMRILLVIMALLPNIASAQSGAKWTPSPFFFTYDTSFILCIQDPNADDLAHACRETLSSSFILKRAIAQAFQQCGSTPLRECNLPFEEAGLPAFGAQIAADIGCDTTDLETLPKDGPLSPDHCVAIAADILSDEGAVPLNASIECVFEEDTCAELALLQHDHWNEVLNGLENGPLHDPTIRDLVARLQEECISSDLIDTNAPRDTIESAHCMSEGKSQLWRDLVLENER